MSDKTILYPLNTELKFYITDGTNIGWVTYGFPSTKVPTAAGVATAAADVQKELPPEYRLMTRHEHFLAAISEHTGVMRLLALPDLPEEFEWHDPETAETMCTWGRPEDEDYDS